jgi:hypothetical protein
MRARKGVTTARYAIVLCCFILTVVIARVAFASPDNDEANAIPPTPAPAIVYPETSLTLPLPAHFPHRLFQLYGGIEVPIPAGWRITALDAYGLTMTKGEMTIRVASIKNSKATAEQQFSNSYPSGGSYSLVFDENHPRLYKTNDKRAEGLFTYTPGSGRALRTTYAFYQVFNDARSGFWFEASMPTTDNVDELREAVMVLHAIDIPSD